IAGVARAAEPAVEARAVAVLAGILRADPGERPKASKHSARVEQVKEVLLVHHPSAIRVPDVARRVGCSPHHLGRIFRARTGWPIHRYLTELRLRMAVGRIEAGAANLSSLALALGFSSHSHFTTAFGARFGCSPAQYRSRSMRPR